MNEFSQMQECIVTGCKATGDSGREEMQMAQP